MTTNADYERWHRDMILAEQGQHLNLYPWHRTVLKLLPDLNGKAVLEVGCGRGDFACHLSGLYPNANITATDFSEAAIAHAQSRPQSHNITFKTADAQSLPFENASFDYVISCECLEHVEHPSGMIAEIARCLKERGEFIVTTENYFNGMVLAWVRSWLTGKPFDSGSGVQPHENFFLFWKVRQMIQANGLTITQMVSNHFVWLLLPGFAPNTFFTAEFDHQLLNRLFRPFGRHFAYRGIK